MTQYCRYCCSAVLNDGFFWCESHKNCYPLKKARQVNKCKNFTFNSNDLLRFTDNGFAQYKPRDKREKTETEKIKLF